MRYQVDDQVIDPDDSDFEPTLEAAHQHRPRPRCLCQPGGIEMYVARLTTGHVLKRMPFTGSQHATTCPSYDLPNPTEDTGVLEAIKEDPDTGLTSLRLDFAMSRIAGRPQPPASVLPRDSVSTDGAKLSLRDLLHYLWAEAGLTRWRPEFVGKRTWSVVRRRLLNAAENKICRTGPIASRLYIPEPFSVEERHSIAARQQEQWKRTVASDKTQHLMLLIAELKDLQQARHGFRAVLKHVPDQAFGLDEQLYRRATRRFESQLSMWATADDVRMVIVATFGLQRSGAPALQELSLMPTTSQWLPTDDVAELQMIERLVRESRSFIKPLQSKQTQLASSAHVIDLCEPLVPTSAQSRHVESVRTTLQDGN